MTETDALTSQPAPRARGLRALLRQPAAWIAAAALLLLAWQAWDSRQRIADLQQQVAQRLAAGDAASGEARIAVRQNQEALAALQARAAALETRLAESQSQQAALDAMVQDLTRNREERLLAEVEQALNVAAQQLQLAGNVEAALIALQGADQRLAAAGRARLLPLRKVLARDIERLKALPLADVPGIALRLESIAGGVDAMPLAFEARPRAEPASPGFAPNAEPGWWRALLDELWREVKSLIRIERLDRPAPVLLSPEHAFFLRENLKLRLLNARLALLQRDGQSFRQDVRMAQAWIEQYYDPQARSVQSALATLRQLGAADVGLALPGLQDSLTTLRNLRVAGERASLPAATAESP
ncbi:MAG TPA: uroporphyrinogen-III C-methyltransferase [Candidatus Desulfobacillus sp.]|nr:uroporphyrinogen-III C-methyltransferase [Candidatus Desulfobacillus sp.]